MAASVSRTKIEATAAERDHQRQTHLPAARIQRVEAVREARRPRLELAVALTCKANVKFKNGGGAYPRLRIGKMKHQYSIEEAGGLRACNGANKNPFSGRKPRAAQNRRRRMQ